MKKLLSLILALSMLFSCSAVFAEDTVTEEKTTAQELLDGKKVLFIGDSYVYYGHSVKPNYNLTQSSRSNDKGGFYQLCKANGIDVSVTNWTFGSHGLSETFDGVCTETTCDAYTKGESHEDYLTDRNFDYVIVSPGRGANLETEFEYIMNFFRAANENVKFVCLGSMGIHGINKVDTTYPDMIAYYETLKKQGVIIADWGEMVSDIINGTAKVEGATQIYDRSTFVVKDNYHPNLLAGYLTTLFAYCAITGEKATEQSYSYVTDGTLVDFNSYLSSYFTNGDADTNFPEIMASEADMKGLQTLVDEYLAPRGKEALNGKKVLFIGNSFVYRGLTVFKNDATNQDARKNDQGYFYQLCKANGIDVEVTNWTFGSHGLHAIFGGECNVSDCKGYGQKHEDNLTERNFDYVFFSPGSGSTSDEKFMDSVEYIVNTFRNVNPDVKFACLGTATAYGWDSRECTQTNITGNYEALKEMGIAVADWGKLVTGIIFGEYTVPGATQVYDKKSFIVTDGYHENMLTGYLTSLMAYCAITGEKAEGQPYSFYNDTTLNSKFDIPTYLTNYYTSSGADETNADEIMESASDMKGLQQVADIVLSGEKQIQPKENVHYAQSFDNESGESITDISEYGLNKIKNSNYEYVNTSGRLVIRNSSSLWKGYTSMMYNPSYTWTNNKYNIEVSGKNELGAATQKMAVYLNYKDINNYYAVTMGGAKYENNAYTYTSTVEIVKYIDGSKTVLATFENTGIKREFNVNIEKLDNTINVYNEGELVATATDDSTPVDGAYVAFGTENTCGHFDSISISPMFINETYLEGFNNTTGAKVTDLSAYGLTLAKESGYEYVSSGGYLYVSKGDYTALNSIMYNPAYTWTNNRYTVKVNAKNYFKNQSGKWVTIYLNYKDLNNYYAVNIGGAEYVSSSNSYSHTATVQIVKCENGTKTVLKEVANSGITPEFTVEAKMLDNLITVSKGGNIIAYATDEGEMISGKHVAFGATSSRVHFDSISVTPIPDDKAFTEDFSNADLTDGTWVNTNSAATINSNERLVLNTKSTLVYNKDWNVYGNDYALSYTVYNSYKADSNRMNMYFNYQDSDNYYCIGFGGATYDSATATYTTDRYLRFTKRINGTSEHTDYNLGKTSSTRKITLISEGSVIKVYVDGKLIVDVTDDMNKLIGGYIAVGSTNTAGYFDNISLDLTPIKAYADGVRAASLDEMAGKTVAVKKNIAHLADTDVLPIAVLKNADGTLAGLAMGSVDNNKAVVELLVPQNQDSGDLQLYLWSDMDTLIPSDDTEKVNLD